MHEHVASRIGSAARNSDKAAREAALDQLQQETVAALEERFPDARSDIAKAFESRSRRPSARAILDEGIRPDGRRTDEIRPIWAEVGVLPRTHGSGLFTRGQTQALTHRHARLRSAMSRRSTASAPRSTSASCTTTTSRRSPSARPRPLRCPGRREIGHGALAERALCR